MASYFSAPPPQSGSCGRPRRPSRPPGQPRTTRPAWLFAPSAAFSIAFPVTLLHVPELSQKHGSLDAHPLHTDQSSLAATDGSVPANAASLQTDPSEKGEPPSAATDEDEQPSDEDADDRLIPDKDDGHEPSGEEEPFEVESEAPLAQPYADPAPPDLRGVPMGTTLYTRVGLHVRATLGASYLHIFNSSETNLEGQPDISVENASVSAVPIDIELWIGGALLRDLSLNLVLRAGQASRGQLHSEFEVLNLDGGLTTVFLGTGLLYHLDPARGWFLGIAAGFERWQASFARGAAPQVGGNGVAASLYAGHDFWLTPTLAFGIVTRLNLGAATGDGSAEVGQLQLENSDLDFYLQGGAAISLSYF